MIFSNNNSKALKNVKSALGLFLSAALVVSCNENNTPAVKGANNATFYVDTLNKVGFVAVGEPNNQGKYNKKLLSLEACMKDNAQTNSLSNLRFDVVAGDVAMEKKTDYRGCVQWQELIEFDPDDDVKNVIMNRSLSAKESHSGSDQFMFTVNPIKDDVSGIIRNGTYTDTTASSASSVTFKLQQFAVSEAEPTKGTSNVIYVKIASRLQTKSLSRIARQTEIETLNLESKGVDFYNLKLDQNLNLVFPYKYYTRFSISLLKQSLDGLAGDIIKKGDFKFYLLVVKENADITNPQLDDVLGATEFSASPRGDAGLITVPIVLNFSNVTSITNRVNFLFTAMSLDTPARFTEQNFEGFANGLVANKDLAIKLVPNTFSTQALYDSYVKLQQDALGFKAPIAESLGKAGLELVGNPFVKYTVKEAPSLPAVEKLIDLRKVVENMGDTQAALNFDEKRAICSAYYQAKIKAVDDPEYQSCLVNPAAVLEASVSEIVDSVDPNVGSTPSVMDVETLNMTSTFEVSDVVDHGNGKTVDAAVEGNVSVGWSPTSTLWWQWAVNKIAKWATGFSAGLDVKASLGGKMYGSYKTEKRQTDTNDGKITKVKELTSLPIAITMNAKVTKCMVIAKKVAGSFSRYFCLPAKDAARTEYYYLIDYTRVDKTNSVVDIYSGIVNPFHMLVRGKESYTSLKETLTSTGSITTFFVGKIDEKRLQNPESYMTQAAPMVLKSQRNLLSK